MILIKGENAIAAMRVAGRITAEAIYLGGEAVKDGVSSSVASKTFTKSNGGGDGEDVS